MHRLSFVVCGLLVACGSESVMTTEGTSTTGSQTTSTGEPSTDLPATTGEPLLPLMPRFDPAATDFYRMPWPNDLRTFADKTVDLRDFPEAQQEYVAQVRSAIEHEIVGFSTSPVVYIQFEQNPGVATLPTPTQTLEAIAPVQMFDVSEQGCGDRVPLLMQVDNVGDTYTADKLLEVSPVEGFALRPGTPYALILQRSFGQDAGYETQTPSAFAGALTGEHPDPSVNQVYAPLRDCLERAGLDANEIAVATVFTTQDPVVEMREFRDFIRDPNFLPNPHITDYQVGTLAGMPAIEGHFLAPIFMRGESPYETEGGAFEFDDEGRPILQRWESVPFAFLLPEGPGPHPVMVWQDGTGWSEWSHADRPVVQEYVDAGFAVFGFLPQFHGTRATEGSNDQLSTYNYFNAEAGRTTLRQQAVEVMYSLRLLRHSLAGIPELDSLDTSRLVYASHSQGTLPGGILAAVEDSFHAFLLSASASYLSITILERSDVDIESLLRALLNIQRPLDRFHPTIQLAQLGVDAVEPHNYARYWGGSPQRPGGANVYVINGFNDDTTHPIGMSFLTIAGDLAPIAPAGWDVDPYGVWTREAEQLPIAGNRIGFDGQPHTLATYLDPQTGHGTIHSVDFARLMGRNFLLDALENDVPELAAP